jgi:hypothetical protein
MPCIYSRVLEKTFLVVSDDERASNRPPEGVTDSPCELLPVECDRSFSVVWLVVDMPAVCYFR